MARGTLTLAAILVCLSSAASAQTADQLVAKNLKARGGLEKIHSVQSMRMTGKMTLGPTMEAPFVMTVRRPKKVRIDLLLPGMTGTQAFDGQTAWMRMPVNGSSDTQTLPAEEGTRFEEQADFDGPLVDYKRKGTKVELAGRDSVDGAKAYKLRVTLKNGDVRYLYLDPDRYLEIKVDGKRTINGTDLEFESALGDYRNVNGLMIAHSIRNSAKGMEQHQSVTIDKIELNVETPDSLFALPPGAKPAPQKSGSSPG
jgi:outer membrane lipoprotein-sorting protein